MTQLTHSAIETQKFGQTFSRQLQPGDVVALYGELGSGKTTFTQGLALGLGIKKRIISPTFVIMRDYKIPNQAYRLCHIDLFRIKSKNDIKSLDFHELIEEGTNIVVIEWPEKIEKSLPKHTKKLYFSTVKNNERTHEIRYNS